MSEPEHPDIDDLVDDTTQEAPLITVSLQRSVLVTDCAEAARSSCKRCHCGIKAEEGTVLYGLPLETR